jgi:hypothetical protein
VCRHRTHPGSAPLLEVGAWLLTRRNRPAGEPRGLWVRLDALLQTDGPRDAGCDATMDMLDVYAELLAALTGDDRGPFPRH